MSTKSDSNVPDIGKLTQRIENLEKRITQLEDQAEETGFRGLSSRPSGDSAISSEDGINQATKQGDSMESRIGEYGMAWMGNIVLLFGILFLTQYFQKNDQLVFSVIFGLVSVAAVYLAGYLSRVTLPYMSRLFYYNGHLLLYIQTIRITLFEGSRIVENSYLGHAIILLALLALVYIAFQQKSRVLVVIVWIMAGITAIASGSTHFMLPLMLGVTGTAILFAIRYQWWSGIIISIFFVYFIFLMWILGNPFVSKSFEVIANHQYGYLYLFACALGYSLLAMLPRSERIPEYLLNASIVINGLGFSFLMTVTTLAFFTENFAIYFGLIAAFCLGYSILLQTRAVWKLIAALYAIYSFVALSITFGGVYGFPLAFFLLSVQSLLVISMALWFRSRFMVIMNTLLFAGLLIAYLAFAESIASINFSFAVVALVTARVMNWKKKRLEIRTELIRNFFLFTGAVMVLFSLQDAVPSHFVSLSWALSAVVFFVLSVIIKNKKYRWLAIITMVVTVIYLFIVDLSNISLGYRIVALMFIAAISLAISIFYSRHQKSHKEDPD